MDDDTVVGAYLARLGLDAAPPATLAGLRELHRAHVARIPYDNLSTMLGRPDPVDPVAAAARAAGGRRVGYCFQQNGALGWLLERLGFAVSRRHGHVWFRPEDQLGTALNHLVLVVSGLPADDNPGGHWWADAGLGEGFAEPLPLVRGDHVVDGWSFGIGAGYGAQAAGRPTGPAAWTYRHLPGGVLRGLVVTSRDHSAEAVEAAHDTLSRGPDSPFRRVVVAQRIDGAHQRTVRGLVHQVMTRGGKDQRDLTSYAEWRGALVDDLLLAVDDVSDDEWASLWERTRAAHRAWDEAGRP
ncbi:arylamine N-acetyltransferase [Nocardioides sp. zg-1228]|uniref:arylamine N-acetyltransferase family protein n=1 Tax=Nocardioides sp. zg-1228 TaxID=2763008 RepID=UPI001642A5A5|nr:arylamine N-acetyltransferase [Nocardioides sp. zg-1228]MBC2933494.1 arylamine N-acetyltransferase [Nocardioides sp. zg-1228]QSF56370.1 arylamine N-acetyltransferase [Nocardioides sp. zg-1228]